MRVLVTGGAGFIGSHLCRALLNEHYQVTVIDNFYTGKRENLAGLDLEVIEADLCQPLDLPQKFAAVINLACPASPPAYQAIPIGTLEVCSRGTQNALELARRNQARFIQASTSEIYGEPQVHPQTEDYRGNVSTIGPRSMYDEGKRYAEALISAYRQVYQVNAGIVRIFNTYGPYMRPDDGRVITNFFRQIKAGQPLTVYGNGEQTRSFCYASDLAAGFIAMLKTDFAGPVNLGNPNEISMLTLAQAVEKVSGRQGQIVFEPLPGDDPTRRRPDISRAKEVLHWEPQVSLEEGLQHTWEWIKNHRDL